MSKERTKLIHLRDHLIAAAQQGKRVVIKMPFYNLERDSITMEDVDVIWHQIKVAGAKYYEPADDLLKKRYYERQQ